MKFFEFGVLTESRAVDICAATDGATAVPAIVGSRLFSEFFEAVIEGRNAPPHMVVTPMRCGSAVDHRFESISKSFRKTAIDGRKSPPYMAVPPTGHGLLASLVCVISIGNPVPRIITGIRWRVGSLTLLV